MSTPAPASTLAKHTAAGQAAGYLYEPERALYWLAKSPAGSIVGVETEDDVVVHLIGGGTIHEQQKHSIDSQRFPFGDTSKDLWNTFAIWLSAISAGEVTASKTQFYLTTNKVLPDCIVRRLTGDLEAVQKCVQELRFAGKTAPDGIKALVTKVLAYTDAQLIDMLSRVRICDGTGPSSGLEMRTEIAGLLHLPVAMPWDHILNALGGWLHEQIMSRWRGGRPALISRDAFDSQYQALLDRMRQRAVRADPEHLVPVPPAAVRKLANAEFVRQLLAVALIDEKEEVIEAIKDFIRCGQERLRLSNEGDLTKDDMIAFDNSLERKWKAICRMCGSQAAAAGQPPPDLAHRGYQILLAALDHREPLAGVEQEAYMSTGAYHRLADDRRVWWHPNYQGPIVP